MDYGALDWFMEEHDVLDERLPALAEALRADDVEWDPFRDELDRLARELEQHLAFEEHRLYPWVAQTLPDAEAALERLAREHVEILSLATTLQFAVAHPRMAAERQVACARLVRLLRAHGKTERRLIARAVVSDPALRRGAAGGSAPRR